MRCAYLIWIGLALAGLGCGRYEVGPFIGAVREGNVSETRRLLKLGADPEGRAGINDWTPLMHAVHKNQTGTARALIEAGAKLDVPGAHNETALMMAAGYGQEEMVRLLLKAGADATHKEVHGLTALDLAATGVFDIDKITLTHCQTGAVKALLDHSPDLTVNEKAWGNVGRRVKGLAGCEDVVRLVEERRASLGARL